jgi:hypothetical protein
MEQPAMEFPDSVRSNLLTLSLLATALAIAGLWPAGKPSAEGIDPPIPRAKRHAEKSARPAAVVDDTQWVEALDRDEREVTVRQLIHSCEPADLAAAWSWTERLRDGETRASAQADLCYKVAETDPAGAVAQAIRINLGASSPGLVENLVQQWSAAEPEAALRWARGQKALDLRDQLLARIAFEKSRGDPVEAARLVATEIRPGPIQNEAGLSVLHQWARRDPVGAAHWHDSFPPGDFRDRAQAELSAPDN